jgi:hypothetical protein
MQNRFRFILFRFTSLLLLALWLGGCTTMYSGAPMTASVVDETTGQPIEGANIVAIWELIGARPNSGGTFHIAEAVTDAAGKFALSGWPPKALAERHDATVRMMAESPTLHIFKSGYGYRNLQNGSTPDYLGTRPFYKGDSVRVSDYDGKVIKLKKYTGDMKEYYIEVNNLVSYITSGGDVACPYAKAPKAYRTVRLEAERLKAGGYLNRDYEGRGSINLDYSTEYTLRYAMKSTKECTSEHINKFFEEYLK